MPLFESNSIRRVDTRIQQDAYTPTSHSMDNLNEKEKAALRTMRMRVEDLDLGWYYGHSANLMRWLRARELNVDKAEFMLRKHLDWRKFMEIDTMLDRRVPDFMLSGFPFELCGLDEDGDIVAIVPYGKWDFRELVESGKKEELLNYVNYIFKLAEHFVMQRSSMEKIYNKITLIFDLEGFSMKQILHKPTIEHLLTILKVLEDNYPEVLKCGILVNAPKIFEILWAIAKPLMTVRTLSKVEIYGGNPHSWKPRLLDRVPGNVLPTHYGGGNTTSQGHMYYYEKVLQTISEGDFRLDIFASEPLMEVEHHSVTVEAGSKFETVVDVPGPGYTIRWDFKTFDNDIGFAITDSADEDIVRFKRSDAHKINQIGTHISTAGGSYTFTFDNSYSRFFSKQLEYAIVLEEP